LSNRFERSVHFFGFPSHSFLLAYGLLKNTAGGLAMGYFHHLASLGALREEKRYSVIANNLSNSQTAGFKKENLVFRKVIENVSNQLRGEEMGSMVISFQQGELETTGNSLDVAIDGEGFFKIKTPQGIRYSRAGKFELNSDKTLVNSSGFPVMGKNGEITLGSRNVSIGKDGSIQAGGSTVDHLAVVTLQDPTLLKKEGQTLLRLEVPQEEGEESEAQVIQGTLELSNVNAVEEMIKMLDSLRTYESCMKLIQANDELNSKAVSEVGKT
jgi:flagellar basal-body rod protein FlgF